MPIPAGQDPACTAWEYAATLASMLTYFQTYGLKTPTLQSDGIYAFTRGQPRW